MRKKARSCLGCLGTLTLFAILFLFVRAMPASPTAPVPTVAPTPILSAITEWAHWRQASSSLRFDYAAVWVSRAYPTLSNADMVRLAHEVVTCINEAGEAAPLIDTGATCLLLLKP